MTLEQFNGKLSISSEKILYPISSPRKRFGNLLIKGWRKFLIKKGNYQCKFTKKEHCRNNMTEYIDEDALMTTVRRGASPM